MDDDTERLGVPPESMSRVPASLPLRIGVYVPDDLLGAEKRIEATSQRNSTEGVFLVM